MINGKIYGIDGSLSCLKEDLGYELNADLVDKNSIDLDDFLGKYDTSLQKVIDLCNPEVGNLPPECTDLCNYTQIMIL